MAMKHFYSKDQNGVYLTFNDVRSVDGTDNIPYYFEQMVMDDPEVFHYTEGLLPSITPTKSYGLLPLKSKTFRGICTTTKRLSTNWHMNMPAENANNA